MEFKVILIGDGGVGKSVWLKRHKTGEFVSKYNPTMGVDVTVLTFNTNYGLISLKVWDCAGKEEFKGLCDGYYKNANGAIIMFDTTSRQTFTNAPKWETELLAVSDDIPTIICGNKCEIKDRKVPWSEIKIEFPTSEYDYFDISAKSTYNFEKPFLELMKQMTGRYDLVFTEIPAVTPPEIVVPKEFTDYSPKVKVSLSLPTPTYKYVNMISLPDGGVMKVTHEYYPDAEILKHS